ncbi:MAG: hypothetical protein QOF43_560 [Gaiellaceae bacterium]|jgi:hypothetical protein|nr:hypothetical protein [Gaiellaceae bacterium]
MRICTTIALLAAVTLVVVTGAGAANSPSPSYQVAGIEIGAPQNASPFFGTGLGTLGDRAVWQASLVHDSFASCSTVGSACPIKGGTLSVRSNNGSQFTGTFTGGSFQLLSAGPGCGRQSFAVTGTLTTTNGPQVLTATLTQFRFLFRGTCQVLAASLQGQLAVGGTPDPGDGGAL